MYPFPSAIVVGEETSTDPPGVRLGAALAAQWLDPADAYKEDLLARYEHLFETYIAHDLRVALGAVIPNERRQARATIEHFMQDVAFAFANALGDRHCNALRAALYRAGWSWERTRIHVKFGRPEWEREAFGATLYRHLVLRERTQ